jgi:hypothetical protein
MTYLRVAPRLTTSGVLPRFPHTSSSISAYLSRVASYQELGSWVGVEVRLLTGQTKYQCSIPKGATVSILTQCLIHRFSHWLRGFFIVGRASGAWSGPFAPSSAQVKKCICLHGALTLWRAVVIKANHIFCDAWYLNLALVGVANHTVSSWICHYMTGYPYFAFRLSVVGILQVLSWRAAWCRVCHCVRFQHNFWSIYRVFHDFRA